MRLEGKAIQGDNWMIVELHMLEKDLTLQTWSQ